MSFADAPKCTKIIKKEGEQPRRCKATALKGFDRCLSHGGRLARYNLKHGLYGRYMPDTLRDMVEEQRVNPRLMDLREQVAVASGMLAYVFDQAQTRINNETKKKNKVLTESEISGIVVMCERISVLIERTARVGLAVKMMVHVEAIEKMAELWVEAITPLVPVEKRQVVLNKLSLLSVQAINQSGTKTIQGLIAASSAEDGDKS